MAPPFMNATGLVPKIFDKIISASQPERFTQDFLKTKLGYDSGSSRPFIPSLKRLGFISTDGTPTPLYSKFRNEEERGKAMAQAIRHGYKEVFERNEYAHDLEKGKFKNLIIEMTGLEPGDTMVNAIVGTFLLLSRLQNSMPKTTRRMRARKRTSCCWKTTGKMRRLHCPQGNPLLV